jgi:DNA-binding response OmpR family regulator
VLSGRTILLVEDEPQIRQFVSGALEDEGFTVTTAVDGLEAIELARRDRPALVVLDMMLPRLPGQAVAAAIREIHADVPILVVTADGHAEAKAAQVGAFAYLAKPFDIDQLLALVSQVVR